MSPADCRLARRFCLATPLVLLAHAFSWDYLRFATSDGVLRFAPLFGVVLRRTSLYTLVGSGTQFDFVVSCTLIDALLGSIPLLWRLERGIAANLAWLAAYFPAMMAMNILRLEIGHRLYAEGLPWLLAHECLSALSYFALFVWIM